MKKPIPIVLAVLMALVCGGLAVPAYMFYKKNPVGQANRLKSQAKDEYFRREFLKAYNSYKILVDSMGETHDAASLNYANAAFMSSNILLDGLYGRKSPDQPDLADSVLQNMADFSQEKYLSLSTSPDAKISSMAANQAGYSLIKGGKIFEAANTDSILFQALDQFKNSLRKDPQNDSARYNYELIKKIIDFPETILAETKALIAQKKYRQAAALMEIGMRRDPRLRAKKDFMERLRTVIAIDSLEGKGI